MSKCKIIMFFSVPVVWFYCYSLYDVPTPTYLILFQLYAYVYIDILYRYY